MRHAAAVRESVLAMVAGGACVSHLARRCGLSQPLMANWLAGRRGLSLASLDAVVTMLRPEPPPPAVTLRPKLRRRPWRRRRDPSTLESDFDV